MPTECLHVYSSNYFMDKISISDSTIVELSEKFDSHIELYEYEPLEQLISSFSNKDYAFTSLSSEASFYYIIGNAYDRIDNRNPGDLYSNIYSRCTVSYRKALYAVSQLDSTEGSIHLESSIKTNLGNNLASQGRLLESVELLNEAITLGNPVAFLGKTKSLLDLCSYLHDEKHRSKIYKAAYTSSIAAEKTKEIHPSYANTLSDDSYIGNFKKWYEAELLPYEVHLEAYIPTYKTNIEQQYSQWCGELKLFLNDLNTLFDDEEFFYDHITLPGITQKINPLLTIQDELTYHHAFDEIVSCYINSRNELFSANANLHSELDFTFSRLRQTDSLDGSKNNIKTERLKNSFRSAYSILDKIAYFIHRYFDLGDTNQDRGTSFNNIFIKKTRSNNSRINEKILKENNIFLSALFSILKDIKEIKLNGESIDEPNKWFDPETESFDNIRNFIEHRSIKIIDHIYADCIMQRSIGNSNDINEINAKEKGKLTTHSLKITDLEIERKTKKLLKLVRSSIMYLSLSVQVRELSNDSDGIKIRMPVPQRQPK